MIDSRKADSEEELALANTTSKRHHKRTADARPSKQLAWVERAKSFKDGFPQDEVSEGRQLRNAKLEVQRTKAQMQRQIRKLQQMLTKLDPVKCDLQ